MKRFGPKSLDKLMKSIWLEQPHIHDLNWSKITGLHKLQKKQQSRGRKWQDFTTLTIRGFFTPFIPQRKTSNFCRWFFWITRWTYQRSERASFFQRTKLSMKQSLMQGIERFFGNNLMISIVVILLAVVNLLPFFRALSHWRQVFCKWCKSGDCVLYDNIVKYLTTQSTFVELT